MADDEGQEGPGLASPSGSRKRPRNDRKWKKVLLKGSVTKVKRTHTGKHVAERTVGPPCDCRVGQDNINAIFTDF